MISVELTENKKVVRWKKQPSMRTVRQGGEEKRQSRQEQKHGPCGKRYKKTRKTRTGAKGALYFPQSSALQCVVVSTAVQKARAAQGSSSKLLPFCLIL